MRNVGCSDRLNHCLYQIVIYLSVMLMPAKRHLYATQSRVETNVCVCVCCVSCSCCVWGDYSWKTEWRLWSNKDSLSIGTWCLRSNENIQQPNVRRTTHITAWNGIEYTYASALDSNIYSFRFVSSVLDEINVFSRVDIHMAAWPCDANDTVARPNISAFVWLCDCALNSSSIGFNLMLPEWLRSEPWCLCTDAVCCVYLMNIPLMASIYIHPLRRELAESQQEICGNTGCSMNMRKSQKTARFTIMGLGWWVFGAPDFCNRKKAKKLYMNCVAMCETCNGIATLPKCMLVCVVNGERAKKSPGEPETESDQRVPAREKCKSCRK